MRLNFPAFFGRDTDTNHGHRSDVGGHHSGVVGDQHATLGVAPVHRYLGHRGIGRTSERGGALNQRQFVADANLAPWHVCAVQGVLVGLGVQSRRWCERRPGGDRSGRARRLFHRCFGQLLGERIADLVADHDSQANALVDDAPGRADDPVLHVKPIGARMFEIHIRVVGAAGSQFGHDPANHRFINAEPCLEWIAGNAARPGRLARAACATGEKSRHGQERCTCARRLHESAP